MYKLVYKSVLYLLGKYFFHAVLLWLYKFITKALKGSTYQKTDMTAAARQLH